MFKKIKGQKHPIDILQTSLKEDKLAHSYLFYGPDGVGKFTTALYFGMAINCLEKHGYRPCGVCSSCVKMLRFNHPDLVYIFPTPNYEMSPTGEIKDAKNLSEYESYLENKRTTPWREFFFKGNTAIRMDCIRMLQHRINLSANEARYKIYIIEQAEQMNLNASNAFLKTLEEPPEDIVIILTSSKYESMLPTILSRCQKIAFQKIPRKTIEEQLTNESGEEAATIKIISRIANGSMEKALNIIHSHRGESREKMKELISILLKGDNQSFIAFAEEYKTSKTLSELTEIIQYLIIWLGDISFYEEFPQEIVNIDFIDELEFIVQNNPLISENIHDLINFLENMLKRLEGNVNPHLVTIEIYFKLKKHLSLS